MDSAARPAQADRRDPNLRLQGQELEGGGHPKGLGGAVRIRRRTAVPGTKRRKRNSVHWRRAFTERRGAISHTGAYTATDSTATSPSACSRDRNAFQDIRKCQNCSG